MTEAQEIILDNYKNPQNNGIPTWTPSFTSTKQNPTCGDEITVYLKTNKNIIEEINFTGDGCSISIATASLLTEEFKDKTIDEVLKYSENELKSLLGIELTTSRTNCALLSLEAIKDALARNSTI